MTQGQTTSGGGDGGRQSGDSAGAVTRILQAMGRGGQDRSDQAGDLLQIVYSELHTMAQQQMALERHGGAGQTLQPTALVNEAYLRLLGRGESATSSRFATDFENRAHFFAAAGEAMRRILVDRARARNTRKRGGERRRVDLDANVAAHDTGEEREDSVDVVALSDALSRLEEKDQRMATIVKLRFFAEMTVDDTADALGMSRRTVIRDWLAAKAWLHHELSAATTDEAGHG